MNDKSKALVLFSGGQDSTTCLFWARKEFELVETIVFDYGQRHRVEIEQAKIICELTNTPFEIIDMKGTVGGSTLTDQKGPTDRPHDINPDLPSSFTPARNAVFLSIACGRAYTKGISNIVMGVCQTDYSGYPDCREMFIISMQYTMGLALELLNLRIHTPLMHLTKAETWKMAKDLDCLEVVIEYSHTDYNGDRTQRNPWGYGKLDNPASVLRAKGYEEAVEKGWI